jgi:hypothetical protein
MSQLASSLLQVITHEGHKDSKKGQIPLFMEFPVNSDLAPFLVTRARSGKEMTLWVMRTKGGKIKAALRQIPSLEDYWLEIIEKTRLMGLEEDWGNVHPLTRDGLLASIEHLNNFGFKLEDLEMLAHPEMQWVTVDPSWDNTGKGMVLSLLGLPVQPTLWLPLDIVAIVPRDREMVGFAFLTQRRVASVVHNAARGLGIATSRPVPVEQEEE